MRKSCWSPPCQVSQRARCAYTHLIGYSAWQEQEGTFHDMKGLPSTRNGGLTLYHILCLILLLQICRDESSRWSHKFSEAKRSLGPLSKRFDDSLAAKIPQRFFLFVQKS